MKLGKIGGKVWVDTPLTVINEKPIHWTALFAFLDLLLSYPCSSCQSCDDGNRDRIAVLIRGNNTISNLTWLSVICDIRT